MQASDGIAWGVADNIGRIALKRQEKANSLSRAASRALVRAIDELLQKAGFFAPVSTSTSLWRQDQHLSCS